MRVINMPVGIRNSRIVADVDDARLMLALSIAASIVVSEGREIDALCPRVGMI